MTTLQLLQAATVLAAYAALCRYCLWRPGGGPAAAPGNGAVLVAYASQGGAAEQLARQQAQQLAGPVSVLPLNQVDESHLSAASLALFIASTYGEGEPPDNALRFARRWLRDGAGGDLSHLHFAVLALGDRSYRHFCGFGLSLESALVTRGARAMFAAVTVDRLEPPALQRWQRELVAVGVADSAADEVAVPAGEPVPGCHLLRRVELNPGSPGGPAFHLQFAWDTKLAPHWRAGDIAVFALPFPVAGEGEGARREYSIASLPEEGTLDLVVRQVRKADGGLGAGSGWLTAVLAPGDAVELQVRSNPAFHAPPPERPLILVGNGTGIAGLRAHLRERERAGATRNWLVFGERTRRCDSLFGAELERWLQAGHIAELDRVFSRDADGGGYVQDRLRQRWDELLDWLQAGAGLYVCGSAEGMAPAIHRLLLDRLGDRGLEALTLEGRYRRDVY